MPLPVRIVILVREVAQLDDGDSQAAQVMGYIREFSRRLSASECRGSRSLNVVLAVAALLGATWSEFYESSCAHAFEPKLASPGVSRRASNRRVTLTSLIISSVITLRLNRRRASLAIRLLAAESAILITQCHHDIEHQSLLLCNVVS